MGEHTSGVIALLPAGEDAQRYALTGGQAAAPGELHVTLQFLGEDVTGWGEDLRARALTVAEKAVSDLGGPLQARVFAHATFNPDSGPGGDLDPCAVYLVGGSDQLGPLRDKVSLACRALLGAQHPDQHEPYIPHLTAGYDLTAADLTEVGPITFDRILLRVADTRTELPLGGVESTALLACRAWERGHRETCQPATEVAHARFAAIHEAAQDGDLDPVDALNDGVTTGLVTAVAGQRDQAHDTTRDALAAALLTFAAGADVDRLRAAVQPDSPRATRRDQATTALLTQVAQSPAHPEWRDTARDAHTLATTTGAAAAAHILSGGTVPLTPEPSLPSPVNPDPWVEREIGGLGGDIAAALAGAAAGDVTDAALLALLDDGTGAQYYLDLLVGQAYLDGMVAVYGASGVGLLAWRTAAALDVCGPCLAKEAGSPYTADTVPMVEHGGCRCQIVPWS